jgi:biotin operon repressor
MTPAPPEPDSMSDAQRLHRIAELLCKAIVLTEASRAVEPLPGQADPQELLASSSLPDAAAESENNRILNYLGFVGAASPAVIRSTLGLSRTRTYRALHRLTSEGCVVASGRTRGLAYRLNQGEPPAERIGLN